jgi:3-keto-disaccharide hydrolase
VVSKGRISIVIAAVSMLTVTACASSDAAPAENVAEGTAQDAAESTQAAHNSLSDAELAAGWQLLFDGETLEGWRGYYSEGIPDGWRAQEGMLERFSGGGDIMTAQEFTNFELTLDWRVEEGGNSGIFYLAATGSENIFRVAPEMQVLDDAGHHDGQNPLTSAGANYGLHPAPRGVVNPAGEWNSIRIKVENEQVEHWMNGQMIVEYVIGSPEWSELVANSKFDEWPEYGTARTGHIGLQDHGDPVWYRNIKVREIG